jgi:hypothetical protein
MNKTQRVILCVGAAMVVIGPACSLADRDFALAGSILAVVMVATAMLTVAFKSNGASQSQ